MKEKTKVFKTKKSTKTAAPKKSPKAKSKSKVISKAKPAKKSNSQPKPNSNMASMIGQKSPNIVVKNSKNEDCNLSTMTGKKIVLYFYPKDDTPGCTIEGQEFTGLVDAFAKKNAIVFGVSRDSVKSHDKFICKYDYKIELLSDEKSELCSYFDVIKQKNMYGKMVMGIERSTFIIDASGTIVKEFRKVKAEGHAQDVLNSI